MSTVCSFHNKITFKVYLWARDLLWKEKEHIQNVTLEIHLHLTTTLTLGQKELSVAVRWLFQGDMDNNTPVFFFSKNSFGQKNCLLQHTNKCGLIIFSIKNFSNHSFFGFSCSHYQYDLKQSNYIQHGSTKL